MTSIILPDQATTAIKNCIDCVSIVPRVNISDKISITLKDFQGTVDLSDEAGGEGVAGEEEVDTGGEVDEASGCC